MQNKFKDVDSSSLSFVVSAVPSFSSKTNFRKTKSQFDSTSTSTSSTSSSTTRNISSKLGKNIPNLETTNSSNKFRNTENLKQQTFCQERFACKGKQTVAQYYCENCQSNQCESCESLLHNDIGEYHRRSKLAVVEEEEVVVVEKEAKDSRLTNEQQLFEESEETLSKSSFENCHQCLCTKASEWCDDCERYYCFDCDEQYHSVTVARKRHQRSSLFKAERSSSPKLVADPVEDVLLVNRPEQTSGDCGGGGGGGSSRGADDSGGGDGVHNDNASVGSTNDKPDLTEIETAQSESDDTQNSKSGAVSNSNSTSTTTNTTTTASNSKKKKKSRKSSGSSTSDDLKQHSLDVGVVDLTSPEATSSSSASSSDDNSPNSHSEGYASSGSGAVKLRTSNSSKAKPVADNSSASKSTANAKMTNGAPHGSSLLLMDHNGDIGDDDFLVNGGTGGHGGWSDLDLSESPPKSSSPIAIVNSKRNNKNNNNNNNNKTASNLPDVAQLSIMDSSPPTMGISSATAATIKVTSGGHRQVAMKTANNNKNTNNNSNNNNSSNNKSSTSINGHDDKMSKKSKQQSNSNSGQRKINHADLMMTADHGNFEPNGDDDAGFQAALNYHMNCAGAQSEDEDEEEEDNDDDLNYPDLNTKPDCFLLIDEQEMLQVKTAEEFVAKLGCDPRTLVKVVSIFGNTGEGKSHTLNYTFFGCEEVFHTSPTQNSCTIGIWCAYDRRRKVITIDTEGLLGLSDNNNRRTRLLLKVLAISDVIIYRTRAERLHNDLFTFLGSASQAYIKHFAKELRAASERCNLSCTLSDLGPVVIIFQETVHTEVLENECDLAPEDVIRKRFNAMNLSTEAYSAFEYVGIRTLMPPTDFDQLQTVVNRHLTNSTVRSARTPAVIFNSLKVLSVKFSGDICKKILNPFPDEYFTCSEHCLSCNTRCSLSMNHSHDGIPHKTNSKCRYQHQFSNQIFYCRACFERGEEVQVTPKTYASVDSTWMGIAKYAWAGFVMECRLCGIIYRSRQFWYGNKDPTEQSVVRTEILHVWDGEPLPSQSVQNSAQKMVDSVNYLSETVTNISAKPSKMIGSWVADQIAPSYWVPNARIQHCGKCQKEFDPLDQKHHCRRCGGGFCEGCSGHSQPVPERGWGDQPVRVCDPCYEKGQRYPDSLNGEVTARKVGEALQVGIGSVLSTIDVSLGWIKDSARPEYWIADKDCNDCCICKEQFTEKLPIHHCRGCGQGVCDPCSLQRKSVPSRGWDHPVRVCDECATKKTITV